jgi:hypothetical protein
VFKDTNDATYTSPLSLVGGASSAGFSSSNGGLLGPIIEAPSVPLSGLGTEGALSGPHIGKLGFVLAYGTVALGSAAEELNEGELTKELADADENSGDELEENEELIEGEVGAPTARATKATRSAALRRGDIAKTAVKPVETKLDAFSYRFNESFIGLYLCCKGETDNPSQTVAVHELAISSKNVLYV